MRVRLRSRIVHRFTYEPLYQQIRSITDESGQKIEFSYEHDIDPTNKSGNLVSMKFPDVTLPDGTAQKDSIATYKRNSYGQVILETSPEGREREFKYHLAGNGAGLVKELTVHDNVAPFTKTFEYDSLGQLTRMVDSGGNDTLYEFNLLRQLVKAELPVVNGKRAAYRFEYNEDRKLAREFLPRGDYSDEVLQDDFILNEYYYDVASWLVEIQRFSNTAKPLTTKFRRDPFGNIEKITDPVGQVSIFHYDERNLLLTEKQFAESENPLITKYHYDRVGNLIKILLPDGNHATFDFQSDPFGRISSQVNHLGVTQIVGYGPRDELRQTQLLDRNGTVVKTSKYSYDERRRLIRIETEGLATQIFFDRDNFALKAIDHRGAETAAGYDGVGRVTSMTDALGNEYATSFDGLGNASNITLSSMSESGLAAISSMSLGHDSRGRPFETLDPLGNKVTFVYDDRNLRTALIDPEGNISKIYYDLHGYPIRTSIIRNNQESIIHRWNRDLLGRLASYQDAEGIETTYRYDERSNLIAIEYTNLGRLTSSFDALNRLEDEIDANGTVSHFDYDNAGQLSSISFQVNPPVVPTAPITFAYDTLGRVNLVSKDGHSIIRVYDLFDRVIEEKQGSFSTKKTYDDRNGEITLEYPDGRQDKYKLDLLDRLTKVTFEKRGTAGSLINSLQIGDTLIEYIYDGLLLRSKKYANGIKVDYDYEDRGLPRSFTVKDKQGMPIDGEMYLYDGSQRKRLILRSALPDGNKLVVYDPLGRLVACYSGVSASIPNQLQS